MRADALSKLASFVIIQQREKILLKHRETPSYDAPQVLCMDQEETWMTPTTETRRSSQNYNAKQRGTPFWRVYYIERDFPIHYCCANHHLRLNMLCEKSTRGFETIT
ncbi:hypothetical protein EPI10_000663 [Gossypium australe]|uniref:Uncharacterized protein n=1 Tax=Gossypium australe TaxID=47621 RepID=A0A5B6V8U4_9ROSI|nr:hypothetical protein EPI10_000663 [Gossypium australe]